MTKLNSLELTNESGGKTGGDSQTERYYIALPHLDNIVLVSINLIQQKLN